MNFEDHMADIEHHKRGLKEHLAATFETWVRDSYEGSDAKANGIPLEACLKAENVWNEWVELNLADLLR